MAEGEEKDDYAVLAAREWLAGAGVTGDAYGDCTCTICQSIRSDYEGQVSLLAAIIRKHVVEHIDDINQSLMRQ